MGLRGAEFHNYLCSASKPFHYITSDSIICVRPVKHFIIYQLTPLFVEIRFVVL